MKACKKKLSAVLMAGIMSWLVGGAADAADLTAVRATNEVGHTRIVLDMKGLPDGWSSIYNEKAQQVRIHLPVLRIARVVRFSITIAIAVFCKA